MKKLFKLWSSKIPKYSSKFKSLFELIAFKGGAEGDKKVSLGKHFSTNYELYMYAFFLGLYQNVKMDFIEGDKKIDFSHPIKAWGSKTTFIRKDFTELQDYMFISLIAKTDIDLMALEKGDITEADVVKELIEQMQLYTNGGLQLIADRLEEDSNYFLNDIAFLNLAMGKSKRNVLVGN